MPLNQKPLRIDGWLVDGMGATLVLIADPSWPSTPTLHVGSLNLTPVIDGATATWTLTPAECVTVLGGKSVVSHTVTLGAGDDVRCYATGYLTQAKAGDGRSSTTGPATVIVPGVASDVAVAALVDDPASLVRASLSSTIASTTTYVDAAAAASTRTLMGLLRRGVSAAQILVIGDSTGNETTEWVYGLAQWLGSLFPAYTVKYYHWNETTGTAYDAATTVQTGTGAYTLSVYNCSVAGARPGYVLGSRWATAVTALAPDLILVSHGHNTGGAPSTDNSPRVFLNGGVWSAEPVTGLVCALGYAFPATPITVIAQNPSNIAGRETWQAIKASWYERSAAVLGHGLIDVHQAFIDYGDYAADLMADTTHPNAAGQALWLSVVKQAFRESATDAAPARWMPSPLTRYQPNLATNALFGSWASTNPDGWTFTYCAPTKDTTNFETGTYGMKLTSDSNSGAAYAELSLSIADKLHLRGKYITVAARIFVPASNTATPRVYAYDDGGSGNATIADFPYTCRDGGFVWVFTAHKVYATSNNIRIRISPRTTGTAIMECTVDRVWIGEGMLPNVAQIS